MDDLIIGGGSPEEDPVKDSDTAQFQADVIDASMQVPVIVDFWAPWCGPCKQLGPALEKVVRAARGKVKLVKINVDENQQLASQLRIQSLPTVFAFYQGRPLDGFQGAQPESQLQQFVEKLLASSGGDQGDPVAEALDQADQALAAGDARTAGGLYQQVMQHDPENERAAIGVVRALIELGDLASARELLDSLSEERAKSDAVAAVRSALEMAEQARKAAENLPELESAVAANPADHESRLELSRALFGANRKEEAMDHLLTIIRKDRDWNDGAGRLELLKLFEALGPTDPLTISGRRKLSSILFS
ncbi:thioredoxin [Fodinicurvata sp. EGI_FJ10296]|uniref:thioredoxin n=1 Tax=Fodinicurvata sp. EGI_FJ10296 TaxID=3231908 RepID=UPI0034533D08